jgi:hypothetical protein
MLILFGLAGKEFTKSDYYPRHVVRPFVRMEQRDCNRVDFREISYLECFIDKVHQFRLLLTLDKITHTLRMRDCGLPPRRRELGSSGLLRSE